MDVSVIICTYNRERDLKRVLTQLSQQEVDESVDWEVIIVDNHSGDGTRKVVSEAAKTSRVPVRYICEERQGKSHAMNTGVEQSQGSILLFTDDDTVLTPNWVQATIDFFERHQVDGMGGKVIPDFEGGRPPWIDPERPFPLKYDFGDSAVAVEAPPFGCNMAYRRDVFDAVGRFRTDLGPGVAGGAGLGEDSEFGQRVRESGKKIMYSPHAVIYHPIVQERSSQAYLVDWHYRYGQSLVLRGDLPKNAPMIGSVPRYLYRSLLEKALKWLFTFSSKRRFYNKLAVYTVLGTIAEIRKHRT